MLGLLKYDRSWRQVFCAETVRGERNDADLLRKLTSTSAPPCMTIPTRPTGVAMTASYSLALTNVFLRRMASLSTDRPSRATEGKKRPVSLDTGLF